jgi:hypothetical protein
MPGEATVDSVRNHCGSRSGVTARFSRRRNDTTHSAPSSSRQDVAINRRFKRLDLFREGTMAKQLQRHNHQPVRQAVYRDDPYTHCPAVDHLV